MNLKFLAEPDLKDRLLNKKTALLLLLPIAVFLAVPPDREAITRAGSVVILSREGTPLRLIRDSTHGSWSEWNDSFPDELRDIVVRTEDKRFYYHPGFDPAAMLRALYLSFVNFRIVSGASTITQQLARTLYPMPHNPVLRKLKEILYAVRLEIWLDKNEILDIYLNRIPLKYNRRGFASAARDLLKKDIMLTSPAEMLGMSILIRRNEMSRQAFERRYRELQDTILKNPLKDEEINLISDTLFDRPEPSSGSPADSHFLDWLEQEYMLNGKIETVISEDLNRKFSRILDSELEAIDKENRLNGAIIVLALDNKKQALSLVSLVGSRNYYSENAGQVNGALADRIAGSTLKPFLYAQAMEQLGITPWTMTDDRPVSVSLGEGEVYKPRNYDLNYWGKISVREALATSRNIPAITLVQETGYENFYALLEKLGIAENINPEKLGPGIALGTTGAALLDLTRAYSVFPAKGVLLPITIGNSPGKTLAYGKRKDIFRRTTADQITHILADDEIRKKAFGFRSFLDFPFEVAAKTGTSKDYRDAWTIGFTSSHVVGVWVGDFSGRPMNRISGTYGAGRIFQQLIRHMTEAEKHHFIYSDRLKKTGICLISGKLAKITCPSRLELVETDSEPEECDSHYNTIPDKENPLAKNMINSPVEEEVYFIDPHSPIEFQEIPVRLQCPGECVLAIDHKFIKRFRGALNESRKLGRGFHSISVKNDTTEEKVHFEIR